MRHVLLLVLILLAAPASAEILTYPVNQGPQGPAGTASGTGTTGQIPAWTNGAGGVLGDSVASSSAGCVTVGTDVFNQVLVCGSTTGNPVTIGASGDTDIDLLVNAQGAGWTTLNRDGFTADIRADIANINGGSGGLLIAGDGNAGYPPFHAMYAFANGANQMLYFATGGTPAAKTSYGTQTVYERFMYAYNATAGTFNAIGQEQITNVRSGATNGGSWLWTAYRTSGVGIPLLSFDAVTGGLSIGAVTSVPAGLTADTVTVTTRTGTPAAFACFDSGGKLVESAVACQ